MLGWMPPMGEPSWARKRQGMTEETMPMAKVARIGKEGGVERVGGVVARVGGEEEERAGGKGPRMLGVSSDKHDSFRSCLRVDCLCHYRA